MTNELMIINQLDAMHPHAFEKLCEDLFKRKGYEANQTPISGDQGADVIISKEGIKHAVQCKHTSSPETNKITNKAIQEVTTSLQHYRCSKGIVITNSEFTRSAEELAKSNDIQLISRQELMQELTRYYENLNDFTKETSFNNVIMTEEDPKIEKAIIILRKEIRQLVSQLQTKFSVINLFDNLKYSNMSFLELTIDDFKEALKQACILEKIGHQINLDKYQDEIKEIIGIKQKEEVVINNTYTKSRQIEGHIKEIFPEYDTELPKDQFYEKLVQKGFNYEELDEVIERLKRNGIIFESKRGHFRAI